MARATRITVDVNMTISDETLKRCCRILEMWMDDNPDKKLVCDKVATMTGYQHRIHLEGEKMNDREKNEMDIEWLRQMEKASYKEPPTESKVSYKELTGKTFNNLMGCRQVLMAICESLEAESNNPIQPEFKCFRDVLTCNMDLSASLLDTINQIAQLIGV